jgi:hypothetical protein
MYPLAETDSVHMKKHLERNREKMSIALDFMRKVIDKHIKSAGMSPSELSTSGATLDAMA